MARNSPETIPDKLQPHNIEAEEAVLGALLIDPDAILRVATFLDPADFLFQVGLQLVRTLVFGQLFEHQLQAIEFLLRRRRLAVGLFRFVILLGQVCGHAFLDRMVPGDRFWAG